MDPRSTPTLLLLSLSLALVAGCPKPPRPAPERIRDGKLMEPPGPKFPVEPGRQAVRRRALACFEAGLRRNPQIFAKGGHVVVEWAADRNGDLLRMVFSANSFDTWEVAAGQSITDCITRAVRAEKVRWSRRGVAPLRFAPVETPATRPASRPTTAPSA